MINSRDILENIKNNNTRENNVQTNFRLCLKKHSYKSQHQTTLIYERKYRLCIRSTNFTNDMLVV